MSNSKPITTVDTGILIEPAYEFGGILHKINTNTLNLQRYIHTKPEYKYPIPNGPIRFWPYHTFPMEVRDPTYLKCPIWNRGFGVLDENAELANKFTAKQDLKDQAIIRAAYADLEVFNKQ
jgi:hypothetical protein